MDAFYDAAIIGGGPAGSTVATALTRAGRRVVLFERETFPRFHIGESLLPYNLPVFERLGLSEKIAAAGYMKKFGAFFWNEQTGGTLPVDFSTGVDGRHAMAYHVKRAEFDQLLLKHSASCGAEVHEGTGVAEILFEGGRAVGLKLATGNGGGSLVVRAKVVVDASGQDAVAARQQKGRQFDKKLKRAALFAHYTGVPRGEGRSAGDILLPVDKGVWYWLIPFSDGTTSVGGVFEPTLLREAPVADLEGRLDWLLGRSDRVKALLANARRTSPARGISDYSAVSSRLSGDGLVSSGMPRRSSTRFSRPASSWRWPRASAPPAPSTAPWRTTGVWIAPTWLPTSATRGGSSSGFAASSTASTTRSSSRRSAPRRPSTRFARPSRRRSPGASSARRSRCDCGRSSCSSAWASIE